MKYSHVSAFYKIAPFVLLLFILQGCDSTPASLSDLVAETSSAAEADKSSNNRTKTNNTGSKLTSLKDSQAIDDSTTKKLPQRIALMPFLAPDDVSEDIKSMLRDSVFSHLSSTNYLFVRPQEVDQRTMLLEQQDALSHADAPLLTSLLDADAILLGTVIGSDVTYVGVAAQIYYKVEMSLVDNTGEVIWTQVFSERSIEGGISADPFSMLYNLAVTAMHVGQENLFAVADKIGRQVATSIPQPEGVFTLRNLFIESVIHDGASKALKYGDTLKVGVKAPPNLTVNVSIDSINEMFNAKETEAGSYFSDIPINSKWNGKDLLLTAYVVDKLGNRARKISTLGLLQFDNKAPVAITEVSANLQQNNLNLSWNKQEHGLTYQIYEISNNSRNLLAETTANKLNIDKAHTAFTSYQYAIVATDKAGNKSPELTINSQYLPNNALKQTAILNKAKLPNVIEDDTRLVKKFSPYLVDSQTLVNENANLFIEPGVVIEFSHAGKLHVQGSLTSFGLEPIIFRTMNGKSSDQTFITLDSSQHVELNGFKVKHAGIAIEVLKGKPLLGNCELADSKYTALSLLNTANVKLDNCLINGSNTSAIVVANNARLIMKNSQLSNNFPFHIQNSSTYSVDARQNQWQPAADVMTILGNVQY